MSMRSIIATRLGYLACRPAREDDQLMRSRISALQPWAVAALQGVLFAALMTAYAVVLDHDGAANAARGSLVGGVVFALFMWFAERRQRARVRCVIGAVTPEQEREVEHAVTSGIPPRAPELRPAAVALAEDRLAEHMRFRTFTLVVFAVLAAFSMIAALVASAWYVVGAVGFAAALVWTVRYPQQLRRRVASLEGHSSASG
jgi:hypothetical protein